MPAAKVLLLPCALLSVLLALRSPAAEAWYKQAAAPSYRSVGRASGLLSGLRRSPYVRRGARMEPSLPFSLETMPTCIRDLVPNLPSCELFPGDEATFKCKAYIFLSLDSADCRED